jgi:internalin A
MVLGNGRVGKTQICRRLRGEDYDPEVESTHGIMVSNASLLQLIGDELTRLQLWDFGGQDIYHGTHALFMRTRAIFLLVWAPEMEVAAEHEYRGMIFRNYPLPYWLDYVRHLSGTDSPVVIVQARCDRPEDEKLRPPVVDAALAGFPFRKSLHYSALKDRGRAALEEALREAVAWLREHQGTALIGWGRLRVQRRLEALRDADQAVPPEQRQYRTLSQAHFRQICAEGDDVISSPEHLLDYLHNAGVVFYRKGLFHDQIILDQEYHAQRRGKFFLDPGIQQRLEYGSIDRDQSVSRRPDLSPISGFQLPRAADMLMRRSRPGNAARRSRRCRPSRRAPH